MKALKIALLVAAWALFIGIVLLLAWYLVHLSIALAKTEPLSPAADRFVFPELRAICATESMGDWNAEPRHWDKNGDVLRGRIDPDDVGQCQINLRAWGATAKKLGIDPMSYNGNVAMANWIYLRYGTQPWEASRFMWDK